MLPASARKTEVNNRSPDDDRPDDRRLKDGPQADTCAGNANDIGAEAKAKLKSGHKRAGNDRGQRGKFG